MPGESKNLLKCNMEGHSDDLLIIREKLLARFAMLLKE
jgi:hypothetical protein